MITAAITMIIMFSMISIQLSQGRENKSITEKLALNDFSRSVTSNLMINSICSALFTSTNVVGGTPSLTFDATSVTPTNPYILNLNSVFQKNAGESIHAPTAAELTIKPNAHATAGIQVLVASPLTATLQINFDQTLLIHPMRDLSFDFNITSTGPLNATRIIGCGSGNSDMGAWVLITPPTSGVVHKAPSSGYLVLTSGFNRGIEVSTGDTAATLTRKAFVSARDSYGQGYEYQMVPVKKDEFWRATSYDKNHNPISSDLTSMYFRPM